MKRFWVILGALAMVCALNTTAGAVKLAKKDLGWLDQTATDMSLRVKAKTTIAASGTGIDTTSNFSLLGLALPNQAKGDAANVDSTLMATVVFVTDSSVAATNDLTVCAYTIDGSEDGVNWESIVSVSYTGIASGDKGWSIPIWVRTSDGNGTAGTKPNPFFRRNLRVRVTSATGNQYAVRPQLWYWNE